MLHRDLEHVTIERDTLKSALSSIFQANKMVKKDILHVRLRRPMIVLTMLRVATYLKRGLGLITCAY